MLLKILSFNDIFNSILFLQNGAKSKTLCGINKTSGDTPAYQPQSIDTAGFITKSITSADIPAYQPQKQKDLVLIFVKSAKKPVTKNEILIGTGLTRKQVSNVFADERRFHRYKSLIKEGKNSENKQTYEWIGD
jgi:hypothetical protein